MRFSKMTFIIFAISLMFYSCRFSGVRGDGDLSSEIREIDNFKKVDISGNFDVEINVGQSNRLEIIAESNLLKYIRSKTKNDILFISTKKHLKPRKDLKVIISTEYLEDIECSGVNNITANGINSDKFTIDLSGAGSINISGETKYLNIDVSGAADLMAKNLITDKVIIDVSGAANAEVYANKACYAEVSGAGNIELYGDADDVNYDISGAGSLTRK